MGADGVIDCFPVSEFAIEFIDLKREGGDLVKLLGVGAVGGFDGAVEFGGARGQHLYRETEASRDLRLKVAAEHKAKHQFEEFPAGRPSKRDRREIIRFRGRD